MTTAIGGINASLSVERIYIGGLDPPRLCATDILQRLKAIDDVEVQAVVTDKTIGRQDTDDKDSSHSSDALSNRPFVHITAVSKKESATALSIIAKQYHNVKWKGCRVVVEAARPSFLDRLAEEQRQRRCPATGPSASAPADAGAVRAPDMDDAGGTAPRSDLPRRLRIRRKHGDAAYHVDTKPWSVGDWANFNRARGKLEKRLERHRERSLPSAQPAPTGGPGNGGRSAPPLKRSQPAPLMHRAVHLRFDVDSDTRTGPSPQRGVRVSPRGVSEAVTGADEDEESSSGSSSSSTDDDGSEREDFNNEDGAEDDAVNVSKDGLSSYAWSDDDDGDEDGKVDESCDDGSSSIDEIIKTKVGADAKGESSQIPSSSLGDNERHQSDTYDWSNDDDSTVGETSRRPSRKELGLKAVGELSAGDEFASGLYGATTSEDDEESDDDDTSKRREGFRDVPTDTGADTELMEDLAANLNILSSIFPDMEPSKSAFQLDHKDGRLDSNDVSRGPSVARSRTLVSGIMPRYDPTAESSKQYVVETAGPATARESDDENQFRQVDDSSNLPPNEEGRKETPDMDVGMQEDAETGVGSNIYKQDKLESVFRDARQSWERSDPVAAYTASSAIPPKGNSGAFTFGFNLDDTKYDQQQQDGQEKSEGSFSFAFNIPGQSADANSNQPTKTDAMEAAAGNDSASSVAVAVNLKAGLEGVNHNGETPPHETRRVGFTFPDEDLQKYVRNFFALNDGRRIMEDVERFRNDAQDKEAWRRERQTLTLDWKRKRKYAMTRIQKRMKLR